MPHLSLPRSSAAARPSYPRLRRSLSLQKIWHCPGRSPRARAVVIRERVAHICDQRQPRCCFRKGDVQAGAVDRVVDHGFKLVRRDSGRQPTQRNLDVTAFCHIATPATRPMIMPDLGDIIGYAHWEIEPRADPCLLPSLPISRLPPDPDRGGSAWWPPFRSASVEWWERGFFRSSASWRTPPAMPCGWHSLSAASWRSCPPIRTPSSAPRFPQPAAPCISW